jgi:hypothetical protein
VSAEDDFGFKAERATNASPRLYIYLFILNDNCADVVVLMRRWIILHAAKACG